MTYIRQWLYNGFMTDLEIKVDVMRSILIELMAILIAKGTISVDEYLKLIKAIK